jgi:mannose-1-phosphate guanylyltransferase
LNTIPLSNFPKQFLDILNTGETLIQQTFSRYSKVVPAENIYIITSREYVDMVKKQLPLLPQENILAEPSRKNTAPCVAYISYKLHQLNPNANLICAPADHLITDQEGFKKICMDALHFTSHIKALIPISWLCWIRV